MIGPKFYARSMTTLDIASIALIAASIASVASRYLEILKPVWGRIPARWQWLAPALLGAFGLFAPAVQSAIAAGADPWQLIGIFLSTVVVPIALAATAGAHAPPSDPPVPPVVPPSLTLLVLLPFALSLTACAGSFEEARVAGQRERVSLAVAGVPVVAVPADPKRCQTLDDAHAHHDAMAKFWGSIAGGAGLTAIPVNDNGWRIGLGISAAVAAGLAIAAEQLASDSASEYVRECGGSAP